MENTINSGPHDTPLTDRAIVDYTNPWAVINLARTLECELSQANGICDYWEAACERERSERQKEIGMQEYRGNTVSYIYDKERNYGAHFDRMREDYDYAMGRIDHLPETHPDKKARRKKALDQFRNQHGL